MKLNLSYRFTVYICGLIILGFATLVVYDISHHPELIRKMATSDAERLSSIIFEQLHTSMRLGGGRDENRAVVERFQRVEGIMEIRVLHGESIDAQYGMEEDELPRDNLDRAGLKGEMVSQVTGHGSGERLRFVRPVFIEAGDCKGCHAAPIGAVAGAISLVLSMEKYEEIISHHNRSFVLWGVAIVALTTAGLVLTVRKRLIQPLDKLKDAAGAIASGDLSHRVNISTGDEIEELGRAFNDMAVSLRETTATLASINEKHARLVEMAPDAILLRDLETGQYVDANPAAETITGYSADELAAMSAESLYPPAMAEEYRNTFRRWVHDGKGYLHDARITRKDGAAASVEIAASLVELEGRLHVQEVWRDLSERKGFEKTIKEYVAHLEDTVKERTAKLNHSLAELEDAYTKLKSSEQALIQSAKLISLGELGAGIAHELNSPLAGILSLTEVIISRTPSDDRNRQLLEKIKDAAVRSKYIILDLLTYSRPTRGERSPIFMNETIRAALSMFTSEIKTSNVEIVEDYDPVLPKVQGNQGQLMEVVLNIIKNSRDAMGGRGRIYITTREVTRDGGDFALVEIRDTGPGIPEEVRDKIFDPFFTTKEKGGGMNIGLGLSISLSIVKEHGGWIDVMSPPRGGAVFKLYLPIAKEEGDEKG